ncbi:MAG: helix-turn-helix transcriptional regulator [Chloroflexi bacterium]|nr:helix-turn-helix transcriptional regulator [Chloroflexota bacterium]
MFTGPFQPNSGQSPLTPLKAKNCGKNCPPDQTEIETHTRRIRAAFHPSWHSSRGRSNEEIAGDLNISSHTVNSHLRQVFMKTGSRKRAEAVAVASRYGTI